MKITRTYKFRLKPTAEQEERLMRACAAVRMIYNAANEQRRTYGRKQGTDAHGRASFFNKARQAKELTVKECRSESEWNWEHVFASGKWQHRAKPSAVRTTPGLKNDPDLIWMTEYIDNDAAPYALDALDQAWDAFYKGKAKNLPAFRNEREDNTLKFRAYRNGKPYVVYGKDCVKIPKIGWVPYVKHAKLRRMKLQTATVTKEGDKWYICVATTRTVKDPVADNPSYAGVDLGTINPIVVADTSGEAWAPKEAETLRTTGKLTKRQKKIQREISRGKKGSKRRRKKVEELARLRRKEATRKRMGLHQITTRLVRDFTHIGIEDLKNKEMTASAKSRRRSGKKTPTNKAQAAFNRAYLDVPKYMFREQLEYKAAGLGGHVLAVDPKNTSSTCKVCGNVSQFSRPKRGERYTCTSCGHEEHADAMAAFNILNKAFPNHRLTMVGVSGAVAGPRKTPLNGGNSEKCKPDNASCSQNPAASNPIVFPGASACEGRGSSSFLASDHGGSRYGSDGYSGNG